jgi:hypothetical protein
MLPLTIFDESLLILQETRSAWNVQFEVGVDHPLDADRLGDAMRSCCQRHPMARARLAPVEAGARPYQWDITAEVDAVPLRVVDCPDATALEALRTDLYTSPIALDASPGFRLGLARRPEEDLVLLSASHVVADGVGCVRLMQTIARAYRGQPDPPDPVPLAEARDVASFLAPKSGSEKWARELELLRRFDFTRRSIRQAGLPPLAVPTKMVLDSSCGPSISATKHLRSSSGRRIRRLMTSWSPPYIAPCNYGITSTVCRRSASV